VAKKRTQKALLRPTLGGSGRGRERYGKNLRRRVRKRILNSRTISGNQGAEEKPLSGKKKRSRHLLVNTSKGGIKKREGYKKQL